MQLEALHMYALPYCCHCTDSKHSTGKQLYLLVGQLEVWILLLAGLKVQALKSQCSGTSAGSTVLPSTQYGRASYAINLYFAVMDAKTSWFLSAWKSCSSWACERGAIDASKASAGHIDQSVVTRWMMNHY